MLPGEPERGVDDLRIGPPVLVDLQPAGARLKYPLHVAGAVGPGARLQPEVDRLVLEGSQGGPHDVGRLLEPGGDQGGDARRESDGHQAGGDQMHVAVDGAGRGEQAVPVHRPGVRPDVKIDPVGDVRVAGPPDTRDPPVLDADVGLDHAKQGSITTTPSTTRSSSLAVVAASYWLIRERRFFPYPHMVSSPGSAWSASTRTHRSVSASRTRSPAVGP